MSQKNVARTRTLVRHEEPHPVQSLISGTGGLVPGDADNSATPPQAPAPAPAPAREPARAAAPAPADADSGATAKKQVNYRLAPTLIENLQKAAIVHSFHQKRRISQNQIVELALEEWLAANGPFEL